MLRALITLSVLLPLAAGCGSDGEKRLSRDEYAKRADAVCRRTNQLTRPPATVSSMPALARFAERTLRPLDRAIRDLRALRPPKDEEATARTWLRELSLLRRDVVRIRDGARRNDARSVRTVADAAATRNERFHTLATQLGMRVCNSG